MSSTQYNKYSKSSKNYNKYKDIGYSLVSIINQPDTSISDIARWQWQLINLAILNYDNYIGYNCPMDINEIRIDSERNIIMLSKYDSEKYDTDGGQVRFTNSLINSYRSTILSMLSVCDNKELRLKIRIFGSLFDHMVITSDILYSSDTLGSIKLLVGNLCNLVDSGLVESIVSIGVQYMKKHYV